jgi:hypothetical protein
MNQLFKNQFPEIVKRFEKCRKTLGLEQTQTYGYFFNFCLNAARPGVGLKRVHCRPHVDWKNLAIGICVIFIYGEQAGVFQILESSLI